MFASQSATGAEFRHHAGDPSAHVLTFIGCNQTALWLAGRYGTATATTLAAVLIALVSDGFGVDRQLPQHTAARVRRALVERRGRVDRKAALDRVLPRTAAILRGEQRRLARSDLDRAGFAAIRPGLAQSVRRLRRAARRATAAPTARRYHVWRRRTKDLWLQLRLLEGAPRSAMVAGESKRCSAVRSRPAEKRPRAANRRPARLMLMPTPALVRTP